MPGILHPIDEKEQMTPIAFLLHFVEYSLKEQKNESLG